MAYLSWFDALEISIHALREEGDVTTLNYPRIIEKFLSTPSARRATAGAGPHRAGGEDFYPRPPRGGRLAVLVESCVFTEISIHALREEGDEASIRWALSLVDFYPRPPRGGRLETCQIWRPIIYFYPRPPRGGRLTI